MLLGQVLMPRAGHVVCDQVDAHAFVVGDGLDGGRLALSFHALGQRVYGMVFGQRSEFGGQELLERVAGRDDESAACAVGVDVCYT